LYKTEEALIRVTYEGVRRVGLLAHDPGHAGVERDGHPGRPPHVRLPGRPVRRVDVAVLVLDLPTPHKRRRQHEREHMVSAATRAAAGGHGHGGNTCDRMMGPPWDA